MLDEPGPVQVGTGGGGLNLFDRSRGLSSGFPSSRETRAAWARIVNFILEDRRGDICSAPVRASTGL
jgi:hypothetical protein